MNDADVALIKKAAEMMGYEVIQTDPTVRDSIVFHRKGWPGLAVSKNNNPWVVFNPLANDHDCMDFWRWASENEIYVAPILYPPCWKPRVSAKAINLKKEDAEAHIVFNTLEDGDLNRALVEAIVQAGQGGKG